MAQFRVPLDTEIERAIGDISITSEAEQRLYSIDHDFHPTIPIPSLDDWLKEHQEFGQTFPVFVKKIRHWKGSQGRNTFYILPIGAFPEGLLDMVVEYIRSSFHPMKVMKYEPIGIDAEGMGARLNERTQKPQLWVPSLIELMTPQLPRDAISFLGVTMEDLYLAEDPDWTHGQENLSTRVGIFSFARYDPAFYNAKQSATYQATLVRRICKVAAHEVALMLVLKNCIYFHCAMNGTNTLAELDKRPCTMCPVCVRKISAITKGSPIERYRKLLDFYTKYSEYFAPEQDWFSRRLDSLTKPAEPVTATAAPLTGTGVQKRPGSAGGRRLVSAGVARPTTPSSSKAAVIKKAISQPGYAKPLNKKSVTSLVPKNLRAMIDKASTSKNAENDDAFSVGSDEEEEEFAFKSPTPKLSHLAISA